MPKFTSLIYAGCVASAAAFAPVTILTRDASLKMRALHGARAKQTRVGGLCMGPFDDLPKPRLPDLPTPSLPKLPRLPLPNSFGTRQIGGPGGGSITDTDGFFGPFKWIFFFGASFFPSLFLALYFLGGYYPPMAVGLAKEEPSWWPTAMQYSHGVNKGTLAKNVAKVEAKEKELKAAQEKAKAAKKAAKEAAKAAKKAEEAAKKKAAATKATPTPDAPAAGTPAAIAQPPPPPPPPE